MKSSRINYVLVGLFVILAVAGLVTVVGLLTGRQGPTDPYYAEFGNVGGLKYGAQVYYEGYNIGQVERIEPRPGDEGMVFRVHLEVNDGWRIPADSTARPAASGLLSAVAVQIEAGESADAIPPGGEIPGAQSGDLFAAISSVAGEVESLSAERLRPLLATLEQHADTLGLMLQDSAPDILMNVREVAADLRRRAPGILDNADALAADLRASGERIRAVASEENAARIESTLGNLEDASARVNGFMGRLETTRSGLDTLLADINAEVNDASPEVQQGLEDMRYTVRQLSRNIDTVLHNLEGTSRNMNEFSRQIRRNPGLLLRGSGPEPEEAEK